MSLTMNFSPFVTRLCALFCFVSIAMDAAGSDADKSNKIMAPGEESVSEHTVQLASAAIPYKATAGTYQFKDEQGSVKAEFFYISYVQNDVASGKPRPIVFSFNGGPGSSSVWMHMGFLGPKRVDITQNSYVPPYSYSDNPYTLLDAADLVFIDPISTGFSRTSAAEDPKQYYDVDEDVRSIGEFIRAYLTQNERWESPKYLIGASYGTMRAVELASHLSQQYDMSLNGVILISSVLDFQTIDAVGMGNDLPFIFFLPSYTTTAWHYNKLAPELQNDLEKSLADVKQFAYGEYAMALLQGNLLSVERRQQIAKKLADYTGLSEDFIDKVNLRIKPEVFMKELLAKHEQIIGRFDARVTGAALSATSDRTGYDPSMDRIFSAFKAAFSQYVRSDLKWQKIDDYRVLTDVQPWNYSRAKNRYFNATPTLRELMVRTPPFEVFVASGIYDLATPFFATDYTFAHLWLPKELMDHITLKTYPAGHMIYVDPVALPTLSADIHEFIKKSHQ